MAKRTKRPGIGQIVSDIGMELREAEQNAAELNNGKKVACTRLRKNLKAIMDLAKNGRKVAVEVRDSI